MLLDISEILRNVGAMFRFHLDEADLPLRGLALASPVGGEVTVSNSGAFLLIRGHITGEVSLQCVRCVQSFVYPVSAEVEDDFDMRQVKRLASRQRVDDETMKALFAGPAIDLNELVTQEFVLNLPINPVCSPDCDPQCLVCGRARSACECGVPLPGVDPRWQVLLDEMESGNRRAR